MKNQTTKRAQLESERRTSEQIHRILGPLFSSAPKKQTPPLEYHVHDADIYANEPAYHGTDLAEAERISATIEGSWIVKVQF
jgi:hypothetical protein